MNTTGTYQKLCVCLHALCRCDEFKPTPFDDVYPSKQLQLNEFEMTSCEAYGTARNV